MLDKLDIFRKKKRSVIAIDGKTISGIRNDKHKAYHVVSAFVAENQITLGEIKVEEKSNEITAVPEFLDFIDVEGAIVTADAMSCQKKIVKKIIAEKADYVIGLKQNQLSLYQDTADYFNEFSAEIPAHRTNEKGHGRTEKREYKLFADIAWLEQKEQWCGLKALGMASSTVTEKGEVRKYTRYFITSLTDLHEFADSIRKHWSIENQLHWYLDVIFDRVKKIL